MATGKEGSHVHAAPATPSRRASGFAFLGAAAALVCWMRLSSHQAGGRDPGPEVARLAVDGAASIQLRDGSRALIASPTSRGFARAHSIGLDNRGDAAVMTEPLSIQPIDVPFIQNPAGWRVPGHGISLDALGEPKSGTTWLGRLVTQLALELCGSWNNLWCEKGGLAITERVPAPSYEFEMISKKKTPEFIDEETGEPGVGEKALSLHYQNKVKHVIPGMDKHEPESRTPHSGCSGMGCAHNQGFDDRPPCKHGTGRSEPTRDLLEACLWSTSERCAQYTTSTDPNVRRSFVIFRDPRDVVISEYRMRTEVFQTPLASSFASLDAFVRFKFQNLVSWIHQRWVWHSGDFMGPSSYLVYYEEAQEHPLPLIGMANFMGLECSYDQAFRAWKSHKSTSPHGDYTTNGLQVETIEWMNATMAKLLPPSLALRYGVTPTHL